MPKVSNVLLKQRRRLKKVQKDSNFMYAPDCIKVFDIIGVMADQFWKRRSNEELPT